MRHLNYNHLHYFWAVANEGSIARAAEVLHLTPQTISGQLKLLDEVVGEPLFQRAGRGLILTEMGKTVKRYADDIFSVGAELSLFVRNREPLIQPVLNVGVVSSIAKLIAYRVLEPALSAEDPVKIVCHEAGLEQLLADLAVHRLDVVLSDRPIPVGMSVKAYNHPMGDSPIGLFSAKRIAKRYQRNFPQSLDGAPFLLPLHTSALRRDLDEWFERVNVRPNIVAEIGDSALLKAFGEAGAGIFPAPQVIAPEVERMYNARALGIVDNVRENFVVISPERRLKHPAVLEIIKRARAQLFNDV
ncbi:MAG: transcriptional activator NhaR [Halioglobus sp.]